MKNKLVLSLGSNIEPKKEYLKKAINLLNDKFEFVKISSLYRTEPIDDKDQEDFYNICILYKTDLKKPMEILNLIKDIESKIGRKKDFARSKGPREIDIDILFFNNIETQTKNLSIPHKSMFDRKFVLLPLVEILNNSLYYIKKYDIKKRLNNIKNQKVVNIGDLIVG